MGRRLGDRKDGALIRDLDSMHFIMAQIYPNRCDNEAFIQERIDLTAINEYLKGKNANDPEYKYNFFQVIVTALLKIIILRPKLNRFIANGNFYQRNEASAAFVVKKIFADDGAEGMAFIHAKDEDNIDTIHDKIYKFVSLTRNGTNDTEDVMDILNKIPTFISKAFIHFIMWLDKHGWVPQSIISSDPFYASAVLSNVGSIKLRSGYHHLTNWGTTSLFVMIGERKMRPVYDEEGNMTMKDTLDIGLTVDERIADGYYYSKSIRLLKKILENPELLERPLSEEVDY